MALPQGTYHMPHRGHNPAASAGSSGRATRPPAPTAPRTEPEPSVTLHRGRAGPRPLEPSLPVAPRGGVGPNPPGVESPATGRDKRRPRDGPGFEALRSVPPESNDEATEGYPARRGSSP